MARWWACAAVAVGLASSSSDPLLALDSLVARQNAERYVRETRSWPINDYRVELRRDPAGVVAFWVIHTDDEKLWQRDLAAGGGGKSFEIQIDQTDGRVLRELGFQ